MTANKPELYRDLSRQLSALLAGERDLIANAANTAALIYHGLPDLNWAGFYFRADAELVLGPFQGKPACVRIPIGTGVCGTAAERAAALPQTPRPIEIRTQAGLPWIGPSTSSVPLTK